MVHVELLWDINKAVWVFDWVPMYSGSYNSLDQSWSQLIFSGQAKKLD